MRFNVLTFGGWVLPLVVFVMASARADDDQGWLSRQLGSPEKAVVVEASDMAPTQAHRDINVSTLEIARAWRYQEFLELQAGAGLFHAEGSVGDAAPGINPDSTATGVSFGGTVRLYPVNWGALHVFAAGTIHMLWIPFIDSHFPAGGTGVNGFLRVDGGVSVDLNPRYTLEAGYRFGHVSNGSGLTPQNPMWNGQGGFLAVRWRS